MHTILISTMSINQKPLVFPIREENSENEYYQPINWPDSHKVYDRPYPLSVIKYFVHGDLNLLKKIITTILIPDIANIIYEYLVCSINFICCHYFWRNTNPYNDQAYTNHTYMININNFTFQFTFSEFYWDTISIYLPKIYNQHICVPCDLSPNNIFHKAIIFLDVSKIPEDYLLSFFDAINIYRDKLLYLKKGKERMF